MNEILILGAGYTGLAATTGLVGRLKGRDDVHITLVNPQTRFTERLRLHQTASGQTLADLQIPDQLDGTGVDFVKGWVTGIDADAQTVRIDDAYTLRYDTLVYALGSVADSEVVPGVDEFAYTLNSAQDAKLLAEQLDRIADGTVVVAGGGLTGIESAAEIAEQHPELDVVLLSRQVPGSMMGDKARARLHAGLDRLGVQVHAGVEIVKVMSDGVALDDGEVVDARAVLWTTGVRVSPIAAAAGLDVDDRGRIVTDESLRSVSHPSVYAVGDAAAIRQGYGVMHGTCQSGIPTALHAAASIVRELKGKQPKKFRFGYVHQPVSLGRNDGVIQFTHADDTPGRFYLAGRFAVAYKETVSSSPWPTYRLLKALPVPGSVDVATRRPVDTMNADQQTFADHRNLLFSIAYRILGSAADAEDAVQDAWFKWSADDRSQVSDPKAYLARIVSNLSMERLRSTRHQRETYVGPWLPEPILTQADAADDIAAAESVSMAMLVVLETLSPLERAVFVLKEVFDFSYAEIGDAVERSESAVRQAAHRAREHVRARRPRFEADRVKKREATERFFAAVTGGDINELMELLAPEVTLWTDGGGKVRQAMRPIIGVDNVAKWIAGNIKRPYEGVEISDMTAELVDINGGPGIVMSGGGRIIATISVDLDADGRIVTVHNVANPDKLHAVADGVKRI